MAYTLEYADTYICMYFLVIAFAEFNTMVWVITEYVDEDTCIAVFDFRTKEYQKRIDMDIHGCTTSQHPFHCVYYQSSAIPTERIASQEALENHNLLSKSEGYCVGISFLSGRITIVSRVPTISRTSRVPRYPKYPHFISYPESQWQDPPSLQFPTVYEKKSGESR